MYVHLAMANKKGDGSMKAVRHLIFSHFQRNKKETPKMWTPLGRWPEATASDRWSVRSAIPPPRNTIPRPLPPPDATENCLGVCPGTAQAAITLSKTTIPTSRPPPGAAGRCLAAVEEAAKEASPGTCFSFCSLSTLCVSFHSLVEVFGICFCRE